MEIAFSCSAQILSFCVKMYSGLPPSSFREDTPPSPHGRLRGGRRVGAANGGRCAPPAGPREVEPCAMAASRLPPSAQTLRQFLRRQQVLQLYRRILRALRDVPAEADRRHLQEWAREEFRRNKDATEEDAIRMMITQGHMQLQELQRALKLAKS
ncbi:LYR motif-containing protein 2 [Phasianus colchicus]|uniref:LYR motif-containing protein 2 n=1 Tax=Phasianus colchicus TaxID=9054 RepID=UPI00129E6E22|nr:LYR motif-containing protein 2 [Phasianus colchicus]